jgi:hypothetical protein
MNEDYEQYLNRLIRIETRLARLQTHFGMDTRIDSLDADRQQIAETDQPPGQRLSRIETRLFRLMESMNLNPRTGKKNDN